jgi:EAL domain-containing protein (putative c-di-GMP-specific phosphodiesterase class I)
MTMDKSDQATRFLGFAFASADLLFEVDEKGLIAMAVGATRKVTGVGNVSLPHNSWRVLFEPCDHGVFKAMIEGLSGAARKGPVRCRLKDVPGRPPRYANVFACRLPQLAPNVSCALSLSLETPAGAAEAPAGGLMDKAGFETAVGGLLTNARASGLDVELALVEMVGLTKAVAGLSDAAAETVVACLSDVLKAESLAGGAAHLQDDRFAVMREKPDEDTLPARLKAAAAETGLAVDTILTAIPLDGADTPQTLRALQFTLDHFLKDGAAPEVDLARVFRSGLEETLRLAKAFTASVKARKFKLVYQPIIDLTSHQVNHYEALVRFPGDESPQNTIRMAEELDLIETLDLAVAEKAIGALRSHGPEIRIAVNVSGRSFLRPKFLDRLLELTAGDVRLKGRLLFEITESAALANLELADERIQRLRRNGFRVCIDDFGAGAASLSYLRNLTVDVVKIDGQYIRPLAGSGQDAGGRDGAVIRHLTALCQELNIRTIAEMVETQAAADIVKRVGVDMGQGAFFGQPLDQIPTNAPQPVARRRGMVESWG